MQQCRRSARGVEGSRQASCRVNAAAPRPSRSRSLHTGVRAIFSTSTVTTKDATAELLAGALKFGLQSRLKNYKGIEVDVQSNALDLLSGKFGGMRVVGKQWRTPLQLTADTIEVAVGELLVDQTALMFQQRVALRNVPMGNCTFVLTPTDLGNFMSHPLLAKPAATAVRGQPFHFNSSTVTFTRGADGVTGQVLYTGSCGVSGHTHMYSVGMEAPVAASTIRAIGNNGYTPQLYARGSGNGNGNGRAAGAQAPGVKVTARRVHGAHVHPPQQQPQQQGQHQGSAASEHAQRAQREPTPDEVAVSQELSTLFSRLTLNMQGVELSTPKLRLVPQSGPGSAAARGGAAGRAASSHAGAGHEPLLLEIQLDLRLLELPPLNMKF